jgi:hypothetical protein
VTFDGQFQSWAELLQAVVADAPTADAYFLVEDDMIFWRGIRAYCEKTLWPANAAICSPFRPGIYPPGPTGWNPISSREGLGSGNAWLIPQDVARRILAERTHIATLGPWDHADQRVGLWAAEEWLTSYFHTPSLAQHLWGATRLPHNGICLPENYLATDFCGEEFDSSWLTASSSGAGRPGW